jgi:hypothetical protein
MGSAQNYILEDFPVETDLCSSTYSAVSRAMYDSEHSGIRESGLYGVHAFYTPRADQVMPLLFGTLYNGIEYAEVLFSKALIKDKGKLEIKLFGENQERLLEIKQNIKIKLDRVLEKNKE